MGTCDWGWFYGSVRQISFLPAQYPCAFCAGLYEYGEGTIDTSWNPDLKTNTLDPSLIFNKRSVCLNVYSAFFP